MKLRRIVARNLKRLRHAQGLSQEELADRAQLNRNYVGIIERAENAATVDTLEKLAEALEVRPGRGSSCGRSEAGKELKPSAQCSSAFPCGRPPSHARIPLEAQATARDVVKTRRANAQPPSRHRQPASKTRTLMNKGGQLRHPPAAAHPAAEGGVNVGGAGRNKWKVELE